jgi:BirA family biotin operon repressor/biotin-[acetyl-CoA-carboxylase] ligase
MASPTPAPAPETFPCGGWQIEHRGRVDSTQTLARGRPAGSAVVAAEQTAGRGQAKRTFASDSGGLYLTAVLPYAGDALEVRGFALAVGWAVRETLLHLGVAQLRLRWPNDLMVEARKVGGILIEQGGPDTLLVGVGLNVTNHPWRVDPALETIAGRLADAMPDGGRLPAHGELADRVLRAIRLAHETFAVQRLAGFVPILNGCWGRPREVMIEPAAGVQLAASRGHFRGIDGDGHIVLETHGGTHETIPAHHVGRLREVS